MRKIRVVNDTGVGTGTKIVDVDTGVTIPNVRSVAIPKFGPRDLVVAEIDIFAHAELVAAAKLMWGDRQIASITLADGEVIKF